MKADALTPRDLFDGKVQYGIPSFQRPYVWNEEDQWAPLWADIKRVAQRLITVGDGPALDGVHAHFLGAVVLRNCPPMPVTSPGMRSSTGSKE